MLYLIDSYSVKHNESACCTEAERGHEHGLGAPRKGAVMKMEPHELVIFGPHDSSG